MIETLKAPKPEKIENAPRTIGIGEPEKDANQGTQDSYYSSSCARPTS